jgi:hypothetical protein
MLCGFEKSKWIIVKVIPWIGLLEGSEKTTKT